MILFTAKYGYCYVSHIAMNKIRVYNFLYTLRISHANYVCAFIIIDFCIAKSDYDTQDYRSIARFEERGSRYIELKIVPKDDDLVEDDEFYYLKIEPETLHNRVVAGNPSTTRIIIQNDDSK